MKIDKNCWAVLDDETELLNVAYGGLALDGDELCSGHDNKLYGNRLDDGVPLNSAQRAEIARFMVEQWKQWGGL
jgi:hypothetical protein